MTKSNVPSTDDEGKSDALATVNRRFNDVTIGQRLDGYLNATAMCKANGKDFYDYERLDSTKGFLAELARSPGIPGDLISKVTTGPNASRGTWVHPQIGYHLAQWCSPAFAVQVTEWILDIATKGYASAPGVEIKGQVAGFSIPQTLSEALRLAADQAETIEQQKAQIEAAKPVVEAFDRIANADGNVNMTLAAKALQVSPHWFMKWCDTNGWTYKRGNQRMAYQDKSNAGYLYMKTDTVPRPDGSDKAVYQVFVTPKGLTKLAKLLGDFSGPGNPGGSNGSGSAPPTLPLLRPNGLGGSSVHHAPAME